MGKTNDDQVQVEAREKAALLLRDRHERESEALATLMAAVSRRATAEEVVARETEQIATRLAELARFGFDDATLSELGIDIAEVRGTRASPAPAASEPPADMGTEDEVDPEMDVHDAADPVTTAGERASWVRTTAHLTGSR